MPSKKAKALDPQIANEALCPQVSQDTFEIAGKTVRIMPLTVFHQIKFTQLVNSVLKDAAYYIDKEEWANVIAEITAHPEVLPKLVHVMCLNDNAGLTEDDILNQSDVDLVDMMGLVVKLAQKNQSIGKPVLDFFSQAWPLIKQTTAGRAQLGLMKLQKDLSDTTTILSSHSASDTKNSPTKSPKA